MNLFTSRKRLTDLENKLEVAKGKDGGKGQGAWYQCVHTAIFKMGNQQGPTLQHRELCSMLCGSLDGRGVWGRIDICMAEFFCYPPEIITTLLISYILIQNKKFNKNKKYDLETPLNVCVQHHLTCEFSWYWSASPVFLSG